MSNSTPIFRGEYEFIMGAHTYAQIPNFPYSEVAFAGASNVGKSSLLNAVVGKKIAIVSATPGRTRQINFFDISNSFILVDMPGYGFAKANRKHVEHWQKTSVEYMLKRTTLKRIYLLLDPIKGLKAGDLEMINLLNAMAVSFQIVFTKVDKLNRDEIAAAEDRIKKQIPLWPAAHPEILLTSSNMGYGIKELQNSIIEILK